MKSAVFTAIAWRRRLSCHWRGAGGGRSWPCGVAVFLRHCPRAPCGGRTGTGNVGGRRCLRRFCLHSGNGCGRAPCSAGYGYVAVRITQAGGRCAPVLAAFGDAAGGTSRRWLRGTGWRRWHIGDRRHVHQPSGGCRGQVPHGVGCVGRGWAKAAYRQRVLHAPALARAAGSHQMARPASLWVPGAMGNAHGTSQARKPQWSAGGLRLSAACTPGAGMLEKPIPKGKTRPLAAPTWKSAGIPVGIDGVALEGRTPSSACMPETFWDAPGAGGLMPFCASFSPAARTAGAGRFCRRRIAVPRKKTFPCTFRARKPNEPGGN